MRVTNGLEFREGQEHPVHIADANVFHDSLSGSSFFLSELNVLKSVYFLKGLISFAAEEEIATDLLVCQACGFRKTYVQNIRNDVH